MCVVTLHLLVILLLHTMQCTTSVTTTGILLPCNALQQSSYCTYSPLLCHAIPHYLHISIPLHLVMQPSIISQPFMCPCNPSHPLICSRLDFYPLLFPKYIPLLCVFGEIMSPRPPAV